MSLSCANPKCELPSLTAFDARIEIKAVLPKGWMKGENIMLVKWKGNGEAAFHNSCWSFVLKMARARGSKTQGRKKSKTGSSSSDSEPSMKQAEKLMVVQAAKTLEKFDSAEDMKTAAKKAAERILRSQHCIVFTGAGISTSAGLGDFRGKSGKWTEEDRAKVDGAIQAAFHESVSSCSTSMPGVSTAAHNTLPGAEGTNLLTSNSGKDQSSSSSGSSSLTESTRMTTSKSNLLGRRPLSTDDSSKEELGKARGRDGRDDNAQPSTMQDSAKRPKLSEETGKGDTEDPGSPGDEEEDADVDYEKLRPTYAHEALALLMERGLVHYIVSQNCDGLHLLSGVSPDRISELHGNVFVEKCSCCQKRYQRSVYVLHDEASQYYEDLEDYGETDVIKPKFAVECELCGLCHRTGRRCEKKGCRGFLEDTIINFRDHLEEAVLDKAMDEASISDTILCLGTTLTVTPACDIVEMAPGKQPLIICNRQKTDKDDLAHVRVFGDSDVFMAEMLLHLIGPVERAKWESERQNRMLLYNKQRGGSPKVPGVDTDLCVKNKKKGDHNK